MAKQYQLSQAVIILAGGLGKRFEHSQHKLLYPIAGQPCLQRVLSTAKALKPQLIIVVSHPSMQASFQAALNDPSIIWVQQTNPKGTGDAVKCALEQLPADIESVWVLPGDMPLVSAKALTQMTHQTELAILSAVVPDPKAMGRIIRKPDGTPCQIMEYQDASDSQRQIKEVNAGVLFSTTKVLHQLLPKLTTKNQQQEYYLTDLLAMAYAQQLTVTAHQIPDWQCQGINTLAEAIATERTFQYQLALELINQGVIIQDPARFDCRGSLLAEPGVIIDINVMLTGKVILKKGVHLMPHVCLTDVTIHEDVTIKPFSVLQDCEIQASGQVGPYTHIRPNTTIGRDCKIGAFVELKNAHLAQGTKANHLSYLGDVQIGQQVNIGAGVITCNYDGQKKHQTIIQSYSFIGSACQLIAPITVETGAYIGAGTCLTQNAPKDILTISRTKQISLTHFKSPYKVKKTHK